MNEILETTKFVFENARSVHIDREKIAEFSKSFNHGNLPHWLGASPVSYAHLTDIEKLNLLLVFNSTSFCYWGNPKWTIEYKGEKYDGSWAMITSILRALENGTPISDASYRATMSREDYAKVLGGNVEIPLFDERYAITKEVASVLIEKYGGDFAQLVQAAEKDGSKLLRLLTTNFPSFEDIAEYEGKKIYFYKRAQLLVEDIYQTFGGEGYGELTNLEHFTACADYKLPQSLRKLGIMSYSPDLAEKIDNLIEIPHGSAEEVEIRASTIWAVETIKEELARIGKVVSSVGINDHLWLMGQTKSADDKPYHRTRTTAY